MTDDSEKQMQRRRLDAELVARGLAPSRAQARAMIDAGNVRVDGVVAKKVSASVAGDALIEAQAVHPWVSRGGLKLDHALDVFGVDVTDRVCLDVGASTGGFTDVLIFRGGRLVYAVDVGRDQLHERLRGRANVVSMEATDARGLTPESFGELPSLVVCDASFISLEKVLGAALSLMPAGGELVSLFKPQFEVGRESIGKGGLVKNEDAVRAARDRVVKWLATEGWSVNAWADSPVRGGDGNAEFLFHATRMHR